MSQNNAYLGTRKSFLDEFLFTPLVNMFKTMFKRRRHGLHIMIGLQYFLYASYSFTWGEKYIRYFYMLKTFEGFNAADYSIFYAYTCSKFLDCINSLSYEIKAFQSKL